MRIIFTSILCFFYLVSYSQKQDTRYSTIDMYYPNYYFFDNYRPHLVSILPSNLGISYSSFNPNMNKGYHIAFDWHQVDLIKWAKTTVTPGHIQKRQMMFLSYGLDRILLRRTNLSITGFAELNFRGGGESFWYGTYLGWEQKVFTRTVFDFGASIGGEIKYSLPRNFIFGISAKQSIYYFRWYNIFEIGEGTPSWDVGTPIANMNFNIKVGYSF